MKVGDRTSLWLGAAAALAVAVTIGAVIAYAWLRDRGAPAGPVGRPVEIASAVPEALATTAETRATTTAETRATTTAPAPATVPAQDPAPRAPRPEGRQVWAVLVGIEDYQDVIAFPSCPGAAQDAIAMAQWLIEEAGWSPSNVLLLADQGPRALSAFPDPARRPELRRPTRGELAYATKDWLPSKIHKGDVVLVFFAGQAVSLAEGQGGPGRADRDYLVPWDAQGSAIEEQGWRLGDDIEEIAARGDVSVVCLLDTSPLGRNRRPGPFGRQAPSAPPPRRRMLESIARWPSATAWMAATEKPAGARDGHGFLTRAFLGAAGTRAERRNLQVCLQRLRHDPDLVGQGFQTVGGFGPGLSFWPGATPPALAGADPLLQRGHSDQVTAFAFSNDGGRLYSASMDSTLRIWSWRDQGPLLLRVLPGTMNGFWGLSLSGDGRLLAAGGGDGGVLFYGLQGPDLRLTAWGDGARVPGSGHDVVIAGADGDGLLHVRSFDAAGHRSDIHEKKKTGVLHIVTEGPSRATNAPEAGLSTAQARALADLKRQVSAGPAPAVLDAAARGRFLDALTLITGEVYSEREGVRSTPRRFPHAGPVDRAAVLFDNRHVVTLDNTGKALLWDAGAADVRRAGVVADGKREVARRIAAARSGNAGAAFAAVIEQVDEKSAEPREVLRLFDIEGKILARPAGVPGRISALCLSDDGERAVVGTVDGQVAEFDRRGKPIAPVRRLAEGPVNVLSLQPLWLVVGSDDALRIVPEEKDRPGTKLELGEPIAKAAFSDGGRRVAACGRFEGRARVWEVAADGGSQTVLELKPGLKDVLSLGFSPDGETLVAGDARGELRSWRLPSGTPRPAIAAHRDAGIGHIAVAPDARALLQVTRGGAASVWEFGAGHARGARRLPGAFRPAGAFLPGAGGDLVLISKAGRIVVLDRARWEPRGREFERPERRRGGGPMEAEFDALTIVNDGRWVAAVSGRRRLACVWDLASGRLVFKTVRDEESGISDVVASDGRRRLLTAGTADGRARIWELDGPAGPAAPGQVLAEAKPARAVPPVDAKLDAPPRTVSAAAFSPRDQGPVAIGREDGAIELWAPGADGPRSVPRLQRRVAAVAFSPDGKYLIAAGDDRQVAVRAVDNPDLPILLGRGPNHFERTNALAFWPSGKLFLSASDDTTVRLWGLDGWSLLGTLASSADAKEWSAFTPNGLFDASPAGQARVTWRLDTEDWPAVPEGPVVRLEQVFQQRYRYDLAETLVTEAKVPAPPDLPPEAPPQIALERASTPKPGDRRVNLRIRMSRPGAVPRLYHNGVIVAGGLKIHGQVAEATIELVGGENRVYAMAGRERARPDQGAVVDGRSEELRFVYNGETPGRAHVLALGVGKYRSQSLRYANADARAIAEFLKQHGPGDVPGGATIVLRDDEVTRDAVDRAFETLRGQVKAEDTLVVFLAGHTAIRRGLFSLLLPSAEMPAGPEIVALRALVGAPPRDAGISSSSHDPGLLPYATIARHLSTVSALRRLIIIDACEAEAIFDDRTVRALADRESLRQAEAGAQRYRTSYILATRRGERAAEATELEHGLLTYALLRGMGDGGLKRPEGLTIFERFPTADFNRDQWIESGELQRYARETLPALAERFSGGRRDDGAPRNGPDAPGAKAGVSPDDPSSSFFLIKVPDANAKQ